MKTNPDEYAQVVVVGPGDDVVAKGLTKREYFASQAMVAVTALNLYDNEEDNGPVKLDEIAIDAVRLADYLIEALNATKA